MNERTPKQTSERAPSGIKKLEGRLVELRQKIDVVNEGGQKRNAPIGRITEKGEEKFSTHAKAEKAVSFLEQEIHDIEQQIARRRVEDHNRRIDTKINTLRREAADLLLQTNNLSQGVEQSTAATNAAVEEIEKKISQLESEKKEIVYKEVPAETYERPWKSSEGEAVQENTETEESGAKETPSDTPEENTPADATDETATGAEDAHDQTAEPKEDQPHDSPDATTRIADLQKQIDNLFVGDKKESAPDDFVDDKDKIEQIGTLKREIKTIKREERPAPKTETVATPEQPRTLVEAANTFDELYAAIESHPDIPPGFCTFDSVSNKSGRFGARGYQWMIERVRNGEEKLHSLSDLFGIQTKVRELLTTNTQPSTPETPKQPAAATEPAAQTPTTEENPTTSETQPDTAPTETAPVQEDITEEEKIGEQKEQEPTTPTSPENVPDFFSGTYNDRVKNIFLNLPQAFEAMRVHNRDFPPVVGILLDAFKEQESVLLADGTISPEEAKELIRGLLDKGSPIIKEITKNLTAEELDRIAKNLEWYAREYITEK